MQLFMGAVHTYNILRLFSKARGHLYYYSQIIPGIICQA